MSTILQGERESAGPLRWANWRNSLCPHISRLRGLWAEGVSPPRCTTPSNSAFREIQFRGQAMKGKAEAKGRPARGQGPGGRGETPKLGGHKLSWD